MSKMRYSRRAVLKGGAAVAAASTLPAPMVWAQEIKNITLRQFGTGVSNLNDVANKVKEDLGFSLEMTALDSDSVTQRAATQPDSFDVADIEYWICKKVWPTGNLQAMDTSKIANYDKIVGTFRSGKLTPESTIAQGTAPHTVGFVDGPGSNKFAGEETGWMTLIPTIYNADTLGIRPDLIGRPIDSWTELLNPEFKGKASILDISSIGIMDMAMVCEAMGEIQYGDKGNMTKEEIDKTFAIFTEAKQNGQFRAFWKSFDESVNLMASGEVRDGGAFEDRMGAVACWNSVMDENQYMVRKWNEFVAA
jgi:putative spermidine/putrescine transport system substrate-binding protein